MSGPKGYDAVLQARLRRERELAARRRTWLEVARQCEGLTRRAGRAGVRFDVTAELARAGYPASRLANPTDGDLDQVAQLASARRDVAARLDRVMDEVNASLAEAAIAKVQDTLGAAGDFVVTALSRTVTASTDAEGTSNCASERQLTLISAALGRCGPDREMLCAEFTDLLQRQPDQQTCLRFAAKVASAVRTEHERAARARLRDEFVSMIARIDGPEADTIAARIDAAPSVSALEALRPMVTARIEEVERIDECRFILGQAAEVWRSLGYDIGPEFEEIALDGDTTIVPHRTWVGHALQVRFDPDTGSLATNVVATKDSTPVRDREIENEHCSHADAFTTELAARGISMHLVRQTPAGELPMQHVDVGTITRRHRRTVHRSLPQ